MCVCAPPEHHDASSDWSDGFTDLPFSPPPLPSALNELTDKRDFNVNFAEHFKGAAPPRRDKATWVSKQRATEEYLQEHYSLPASLTALEVDD